MLQSGNDGVVFFCEIKEVPGLGFIISEVGMEIDFLSGIEGKIVDIWFFYNAEVCLGCVIDLEIVIIDEIDMCCYV